MRNKDKDSYIKFLAFIDILIKYSDEDHPMKVEDIRNELYTVGDYQFNIDFRMIDKYIEYYNQYYDDDLIQSYKKGRNKYYYFNDRRLDSMEAKAIIDLIDGSDFFTKKTKENYKKRIGDMFSVHYQVYFKNPFDLHINRNENDQVFYRELETITLAINQKKKIKFKYKKPLVKKKANPKEVTIGPVYTYFRDNEYYLVCQGNKNPEDCITYRLDYVSDVEIIEDSKVECTSRELSLIEEHLKKVTYMFGEGKTQTIELEFIEDIYGNIIDKFGKDIKPRHVGEDHYRIQVDIIVSHTFYSWIVGFNGKVKIVGDKNQVEKFQEFLKKFL